MQKTELFFGNASIVGRSGFGGVMDKVVEACGVPEDALIRKALPRIDYADAYRARVRSGRNLTVDDVFRAFLHSAPAWVSALMRLRNSLVSVFGLKTTGSMDPKALEKEVFRPGDDHGLFKVLQKDDRELLAGEDDKHLDFRVSCGLVRTGGGTVPEWELVISTTVHFRNVFGRMYFLPVKPFHRWIVPAMMKRIVRDLEGRAG